jgi:hypothetical protein
VRQCDDLFTSASEKRIGADEERSGTLLAEPCESSVQVTFGTRIEKTWIRRPALDQLPARAAGVFGLLGLTDRPIASAVGTNSRSRSSCFASNSLAKKVTPVTFPPAG